VFEGSSIAADTVGVGWVGVCVLAFVKVFFRGVLFEEKEWRGVDYLGSGVALVKGVGVPVVSGVISSRCR
jgi:hypothetical protein